MSAFFTKFGIQPMVLIAQVINFALLAFVLFKLVYKPILKVLDERRKKIELSLNQAKELDEKTKHSQEEYQQVINKAKDEAKLIVKEAKELGEKSRQELILQGQKQAQEIEKKADLKLERERERLEAGIREKVTEIALLATERVLKSKLDQKYVDKYVEEVIGEMKNT